VCIDTGPRCYTTCDGLAPGNYQWCGACNYFIQCVGGQMFFQLCPSNLVWHDLFALCLSASPTCTECLVYAPTTTPHPDATTVPTPSELILITKTNIVYYKTYLFYLNTRMPINTLYCTIYYMFEFTISAAPLTSVNHAVGWEYKLIVCLSMSV